MTRPECEPANSEYLRAHPQRALHIEYVRHPRVTTLARRLGATSRVYGDYLLWQRAALRRARQLDEFDVVHHVTWNSALFGSPLWRLGTPLVFGPVGAGQLTPVAAKPLFGRGWRRERWRNLVVRCSPLNPLLIAAVRHAELSVASNSETRRVLEMAGGHDVKLVVEAGLLPEQLDRPPVEHLPRTELRVAWVGGHVPRKALPLALDAVDVARRDVSISLVIAGGGDADQIARLLRERGLEGVARHVGLLPWSAVQDLYHDVDVFLFSSVRDTFGAQLMEASAAGLPIVGLDLHGVHDHVPNTAAIKVPLTSREDTARDLAHALVALANDPLRRAAMGAEARRFAERHTWRAQALRATQWYRDVMAEGVSDTDLPSRVPEPQT